MSTNTSPRVTVVVIAFNADRYIRQTLDSVVAQSYADVEVIVVDDGSTDRTRECVLSFGSRVRYLHQANSGACSKPRNTGVAAATGEFVAFLDSDDLMARDRLATEVEFLRKHPSVGLVFSDYQDFDESGVHEPGHFSTCPQLGAHVRALPRGTTELVLSPAVSTEILLTENFGSSSPTVRRFVVDEVGAFDESLKASEDFDFQYRVASRYPIGVIARTGWFKRLHLASMSSNTPNILHHKILTRRRLLAQEPIPGRRRKLKERLAIYHAALGYYYTGRDSRLALRHCLASVALSRRPQVKLLGRLACDVLGRDTNRARV